MKEDSIKNVFKEFITLSYSKSPRKSNVKDIYLNDYIIARFDYLGCTIHYMFSGNSLIIPFNWIDIFTCFSIHSGDKIQYCSIEDNIDRLISIFSELCNNLSRGVSKVDGNRVLGYLSDISSITTLEFRKYVKKEHNIVLDPLEFNTPINSIEF